MRQGAAAPPVNHRAVRTRPKQAGDQPDRARPDQAGPGRTGLLVCAAAADPALLGSARLGAAADDAER